MSSFNLNLIQVLVVVLIDIKRPHVTGRLPTMTIKHLRRMQHHPHRKFIYLEVWPYDNNQDYQICFDYIYETILPQSITNGILHNLVIPGALVDRFMDDICHGWLAML
jgi:hypothetical protein